MAHASSESIAASLDPQDGPTFKAVIAYEDLETGQHARNVCDFLIERLGQECQFLSQMWRFDVLRIPDCRDLAAKGAAMADVIMISSHGVGDLPVEVKVWIELWLRDKGDVLALVALFDRPCVEAAQDWPVREYLAGVAERGQINFFSEPDIWPGREPHQQHLALEPNPDGNTRPSLPFEAVTTRNLNVAHWGLNE